MIHHLPISLAAVLMLAGCPAIAGDINNPSHLSNTGNDAINNVKARQFMMGGQNSNRNDTGNGNAYDPNTDTLVHMGSAKRGNCTMNVGGTTNGKDVVVSAHNIINVCK